MLWLRNKVEKNLMRWEEMQIEEVIGEVVIEDDVDDTLTPDQDQ